MGTAAPHQVAPRRMSLDEWAALSEDEPGELVDGELVEDEVSDFDHEEVVTWLMLAVGAWVMARGGRIYASDGKYAVRRDRGRKADLSVFLPGTRLPPKQGASTAPPDIMVEVISSDPRDERRDRVEKAAEYAAFGVRWYWLVDLDVRSFEIHELADGRYGRAMERSSGVIDVPGCEGLRLDLDALWAYVERA